MSCWEIEHLKEIEEIQTGKGLNQIGTLQRPGDTRWSSHFTAICSLIRMYGATRSVLIDIAAQGTTFSQRDSWFRPWVGRIENRIPGHDQVDTCVSSIETQSSDQVLTDETIIGTRAEQVGTRLGATNTERAVSSDLQAKRNEPSRCGQPLKTEEPNMIGIPQDL
ncbi:hypothetical protein POM88_042724 [Heracleum sosnowskyi]|uniref:Uncharacterized protein n=1 Tax=Heracleum sosnowskyi TaxID=360622 RepID=A0AAD8HI88_9APIA|nr:hypothetical protein POM88_042724 [Heracleum sosnowskyi]